MSHSVYGVGIKFSYPSTWGKINESREGCELSCSLSIISNGSRPNFDFQFILGKFSKENCGYPNTVCNSLMDLLQNIYEKYKSIFTGFNFVNDNQTIVGKKYPAWQLEFSFLNDGVHATGLQNGFTTDNETYYIMGISFPDELSVKLLPQFRKLIDSVELLPINRTAPKIPSFMNSNISDQQGVTNSPDNNALNGLNILSHSSYVDSIGYYHVVGEVENITPTNAEFVKISGTFYDSNNEVVGTSFSYTDPSDIGSGNKAPFELILTSASVPVSQIGHYNLQASHR